MARISEVKQNALIIDRIDNREQGRHFSDISIKNFRCFKNFSIGSLNRVNLIGGMNNVGKTTLLESIFLLLGGTNINVVLKISAFRGIERFEGDAALIRETLWGYLFHNFDNQGAITIQSELGSGKRVSVVLKQTAGETITLSSQQASQGRVAIDDASAKALQLKYTNVNGKTYTIKLQVDSTGIKVPPPLEDLIFPGIFLSARRRPTLQENATRYGQLELAKSDYDLLKALQSIEPRLQRLSTIVGASGPVLHGDIGLGQMVPLPVMGDGLSSLVSLLLTISSAPNGVVLIDEIENGFHYSVLEKVWQAIAEAARRYNTQVFATTHSWECIKAASEAFSTAEPYDFCYHRLEQIGDIIKAVSFDRDTLQSTIETGWEIR